ncbi:acetyl-CoA carboxylase biotin carboxyl carrier protein subunit [Helicobacter sp. NHP19-012]|uniref:Biotin carboxyl carrier protein of acetyl-CoA carboxylase n=1 Tax=Helicobacter gastrofelis TaxID=2849642 RepID=A0ABM7SNF3_9HELI|nr:MULTISPECIES: acetyl-CoA carboxylase [unclassified Helicobacter]BCZ19623.1 acetyl-CoA carboxylase biotin carboxyl carrier protein subunit [Helicobacter sp. NHP19-012]GMB96506.1 acetyl-CoA carboxylase [Helicobacter sp. NHP22-001]
MHEVISPIPGTFYRKPNPDAAPFVEVGSQVEPDTTLCLVEVMKTFNEIKAGVAGKIIEIKAENEQFVNPGDVLFVVG